MKALAFVFGLCIATVGVVGLLAPSGVVWIAQHFVTSGRVLRRRYGPSRLWSRPDLGGIDIPRAQTLRVLGYVIVIAGIATALTGLLGIGRARAIIEWWLEQGPGVVRLTGVLVLALGGFVAYACGPARRAA